ncbi:MAG TPA: 30S ribosomal protein S20 [bacterium]|nr:30S ribosomal protein S20 [bacterium]HQO34299.1 30S ribosomal protein S20 [bacterium]HQP99374.1 30S ribosomal protein S20 [bacterium]
MPNHKQAEKRLKQDKFRRLRNRNVKSRIHTLTKKVMGAENPEQTETLMRSAFSLIDSAAKRHVIHRRKAARKKSRLNRAVNRKQAAAV